MCAPKVIKIGWFLTEIFQKNKRWTFLLGHSVYLFVDNDRELIRNSGTDRDVVGRVDSGWNRVVDGLTPAPANWHTPLNQSRSQKFSTGGASICSIPFCPFPFSCPAKSAVQSENVMTHHTAWMIERTMIVSFTYWHGCACVFLMCIWRTIVRHFSN